MQISINKPPIFDKASELFGVKESDPIFYTYGDVIYSPCKKIPPVDLIVHEETHSEQQHHSDEGAKEWWDRYFTDKDFRMHQEAEAYGNQYKFLCRQYKDRNKQSKMLLQLAGFLSGKMYGNCISQQNAVKLIKDYAEGTSLKDIENSINDDEI